ncbi:hypothetical protein GDO86_016179 [Hymenochirus boettgeri]|uniref:Galectin n=1 Tax=Hymenochirus boettgeri TaxID=247094 RepID=A0A8T2JW01_9PIPI|nr:hypothetical protein GDO86_016179 [Hymenochirus boettgeri]
MADDFSLSDAVNTSNAANTQQEHGQPQNQGGPWGYPNAPQGQPWPGYSWPGFQGPAPGQQYPGFQGPAPGQQYPGFQGPAPGQQYPGFPPAGQGYPGFPAPGQSPGASGPQDASQQITPKAPVPLSVPCEIPLTAGIIPRLQITICGTISPTARRFGIDLRKGKDIAFHFNPRFDEHTHVVVRNTMVRDVWGSEERKAAKFPFVKGQPFMIQILCEQDHFNVSVNNENFCRYAFRVHELAEIKTVNIGGDVTLSDVRFAMM